MTSSPNPCVRVAAYSFDGAASTPPSPSYSDVAGRSSSARNPYKQNSQCSVRTTSREGAHRILHRQTWRGCSTPPRSRLRSKRLMPSPPSQATRRVRGSRRGFVGGLVIFGGRGGRGGIAKRGSPPEAPGGVSERSFELDSRLTRGTPTRRPSKDPGSKIGVLSAWSP